MVTFKRSKSKLADRGKSAETAVQKMLAEWASESTTREFQRLADAKSAGRIMKAAVADFEIYSLAPGDTRGVFGLIEVKETEHEYRLARDKVSQLPAMRKRAHCGGMCVVLVHHSTLKLWRALNVHWMEANGDKGSWNISQMPTFTTPRAALSALSGVFG